MKKRNIWALALSTACALGASMGSAQAEPAPKTQAMAPVTLQYEAHRTWDFVLPTPTFTVVSDQHPLQVQGGPICKTEKDGESLKIDTDGDGTFDVTARGKAAMVRLTFAPEGDEGGKPRTRALRLINQGGWKYAAGGSWSGTIDGTRIRLIDQNNDGDATDIGQDALIIGDRTHAQLLSRIVAMPTGLFRLKATGTPPVIELTPYEGKTGILNLQAGFTSKGRLMSAVVRSISKTRSFDVAGLREGLRVPVGTYEFVSGQVARGEHRVTIEPGNMPNFKVNAETPQTLTWGGPLTATYSWKRAGDKLVVSPQLVQYSGAAGEAYSGFSPPGPSPEFVVTTKNDDKVEEVARARFGGT